MGRHSNTARPGLGWCSIKPSGKMYKFHFLYRFFMHTLALSEFRANVSAMLDLVEQGQTVRILRHGKPVADLVPVKADAKEQQPAWKQAIAPACAARADGKTAAQLLLEERE